jgi:hypothetical protein
MTAIKHKKGFCAVHQIPFMEGYCALCRMAEWKGYYDKHKKTKEKPQ